MKDHAQQRTIDVKFPVIFDQTEPAEFVHEKIDSSPRRSDHLRERLLIDLSDYGFSAIFLSVMRQQ